ncbi:hypothetical protein AWB73_00416 [Caballeronia turbans]|nr:hypothetical protein AWB73_00416 [Caballeronia turbans]
MHRQAKHVHRRREPLRMRRCDERCESRVGRDHRPVTIDGERRIRLVPLQHEIDRAPRGGELRIGQRALAIQRRITGRDEQRVARAQRHVQSLGEAHEHFAARQRAARFDEAQMARGHIGDAREIELAHASALPPFAQQCADARLDVGACEGRVHVADVRRSACIESITCGVIAMFGFCPQTNERKFYCANICAEEIARLPLMSC